MGNDQIPEARRDVEYNGRVLKAWARTPRPGLLNRKTYAQKKNAASIIDAAFFLAGLAARLLFLLAGVYHTEFGYFLALAERTGVEKDARRTGTIP